jgi:hypothetical protein
MAKIEDRRQRAEAEIRNYQDFPPCSSLFFLQGLSQKSINFTTQNRKPGDAN